MQKIEWNDGLSVGVDEIDAQHRAWIDRYNSVAEAIAQRRGSGEVSRTLGFLVDYTEEHFGTEEEKMHASEYPDADAHLAKHNELRGTLDGLVQDFREDGPTEELAVATDTFLGNWLIKHIREVDTKLGAYLNS